MREAIKKYYPNITYDKHLVNKSVIKYNCNYDEIKDNLKYDNFNYIVNVILSIINEDDTQFELLLKDKCFYRENYNLTNIYMYNFIKKSIFTINIKYIYKYIDYNFMNEYDIINTIKLEIYETYHNEQYNETLNVINKCNNILLNFNKTSSKYPIFRYIHFYNSDFEDIFKYYINNISNSKLIDIIDNCNYICIIQYIFTSCLIKDINNPILEYIIKKYPKTSLLLKCNNKHLLETYKYNNNFNYQNFFDFYNEYYEYDNVKEMMFDIIKIYKNLNYIIHNIDLNQYNFYINPSKIFKDNKIQNINCVFNSYPDKYIKVSFLHILSCIKEFKYNKHIKIIKLFCDKYPELINDNNNELKLSPLHCALLVKNKIFIKEVLFKYDLNVYIDDINNTNPFEYIILNNYNQSYIKMFLNKYDIYKLHNNENIIIMAIRTNNKQIIEFLSNFYQDDYEFYNIGIANWIEQLNYENKINSFN